MPKQSRGQTTGVSGDGTSPKLLVSVEEAAALLSLGRTLVYELVMRHQIDSIKIGRTRRIPIRALEAFVQAQLMEADGG